MNVYYKVFFEGRHAPKKRHADVGTAITEVARLRREQGMSGLSAFVLECKNAYTIDWEKSPPAIEYLEIDYPIKVILRLDEDGSIHPLD